MKIRVIFTGGTIGSRASDGWISPDGQTKRELIEHYRTNSGSDVEFLTCEPYCILSENLAAENLNLLIKTVKGALEEGVDGIIVTHGTDTLQYSAAALEYAFGNDTVPIVLVSANYPLNDSRSNGHANFEAAVELIKQKKGKGVYVAYKNRDTLPRLHRGVGILGYRETDDGIHSINDRHYAEFTAPKEISILPSGRSDNKKTGEFTLCDSPEILVISIHPADSYDYNLEGFNAVILRPYHSGTVDTENAAFREFCKKSARLNVPLFMVNARKDDTYASAKALSELGVIPLYSSAFPSVYVRLWIAVSRGECLESVFN